MAVTCLGFLRARQMEASRPSSQTTYIANYLGFRLQGGTTGRHGVFGVTFFWQVNTTGYALFYLKKIKN